MHRGYTHISSAIGINRQKKCSCTTLQEVKPTQDLPKKNFAVEDQTGKKLGSGKGQFPQRRRQNRRLMTIETPLANRPRQRHTMFAQAPAVFHDYATSPVNPDHSLQMDIRFTSSPNSVTFYEGEFMPGSLGSVCSEASFVDTGQSEDFDLKPQYECTNDSLLNLNMDMHMCEDLNTGVRGDVVWSPNDAGAMKMEDVFQVDQKDAIQGPTLAELNFDDSVYDDIESIIQKDEQESRKIGSGGCALWQQAHQSSMDSPFSVPHVITGGQKPPIKFTTCTVTSPTSSIVDVTVDSVKPVTSVASGLFAATPKPFTEAPCVKTEPMDTQMAPKCLKMAQSSSLGLLAPMTAPVPIPARSQSLAPLSIGIEPDAVKASSLQRLLTDPMPITTIKREPGVNTSFSYPSTKPSLLHRTFKRSHSPGADIDSMRAMEQKWEEIKQFIHDDEQTLSPEPDGKVELSSSLESQQQQQSHQPPKQQQKQPQLKQQMQQEGSPALAIPVSPAAVEPLKSPKRIKVEPKDPAFTPKDDVDSGDEDHDSDAEDSDDVDSVTARDDDQLSDTESDQFSILEDSGATTSKGPPRYFWMYNTQSKGPKGKRLCKAVNAVDPYTLADFEDPVFDPELNQTQYKHNGKARRGDGNDITPSPGKLYALGNELKKLNRIINDLTPVSELPAGARTKSRKEKNKLASRACRLKKKAQHEANKVKLYGLEREHHDLLLVLDSIRRDVFKNVSESNPSEELLVPKLEKLMKTHLKHMIAGHTADYVNSILSKVMNGDSTGGLST